MDIGVIDLMLGIPEGTVRYPEAGGSSSFARHAFNELVSFIRETHGDHDTDS